MSDAPIVVFDPMPAEPAAHRVREGVYLHNVAKTGLDEYAPVGFFLRSPRGETLGGLLGSIWGGWLHITHLWVSQGARGAGHGARLLADAEAYAKEKSCFAATLKTTPSRPARSTRSAATTSSPNSRTSLWSTRSISCAKTWSRRT
ncbi:MAG: GNAT family N-acetyltransferase [Alphaproteobacteria bacterium]|nr:GNAT family N-acetyltransferase [Alphaproteobacteria bacterium]